MNRIGFRKSFLFAIWSSCVVCVCFQVGCGNSGSTVLPEGNLSAEQIEKLKAEDAAVDDEESQGKRPKPKGKK